MPQICRQATRHANLTFKRNKSSARAATRDRPPAAGDCAPRRRLTELGVPCRCSTSRRTRSSEAGGFGWVATNGMDDGHQHLPTHMDVNNSHQSQSTLKDSFSKCSRSPSSQVTSWSQAQGDAPATRTLRPISSHLRPLAEPARGTTVTASPRRKVSGTNHRFRT